MNRWWWFLAWALVGLMFAFGIAALLTVGIVAIVLAAVLTVVLTRVQAARGSAWGLGIGIAVLFALLAYLNRHGPGNYCTYAGGGQQCEELYSPWPFAVIAIAIAATAVIGQWRSGRSAQPPSDVGPIG